MTLKTYHFKITIEGTYKASSREAAETALWHAVSIPLKVHDGLAGVTIDLQWDQYEAMRELGSGNPIDPDDTSSGITP